MIEKRIVGVSPWSNPNYRLIKETGINCVRIGFDFPFVDRLDGKINPKYHATIEHVKKLRSQGLRILGVSTLAGMLGYDSNLKKDGVWMPSIPAWAGTYTQSLYYDVYEKACAYMAAQTIGLVDFWQVSNEMDLVEFRGPMSVAEAMRFMVAGARGLKKGNPSAMTGINPAGLTTENARLFFTKLYGMKHSPFDYAGIDGYFGSWVSGGVQDWVIWIDEIHSITGRPVLVNEWGYSSLGGKPVKRVTTTRPGVNPVCKAGAWFHAWKDGHTQEEQGEYLATGLKIFATYPHCLGSVLYSWGDSETCWHCGGSSCPAECGWGIVDNKGKMKASYQLFKNAVKEYY